MVLVNGYDDFYYELVSFKMSAVLTPLCSQSSSFYEVRKEYMRKICEHKLTCLFSTVGGYVFMSRVAKEKKKRSK